MRLRLLATVACLVLAGNSHAELMNTASTGRALRADFQDCIGKFSDQGYAECLSASFSGTPCPQACKDWFANLGDCLSFLSQFNSEIPDPSTWYDTVCSGTVPSSPAATPSSPIPSSPIPSSPIPSTPSPPGGSWDFNLTGYSSNFTCDTAAGFAWITLDPSLASWSAVNSTSDFGPGVALNSTCADLNVTGCCTEAPASNFTWIQYGLGQPMVVQGVRITAPAGDCCLDGDCLLNGSEPCNQRALNTFVYVGNSSVADVKASPEWAQLAPIIAASGGDAGLVDTYLWSVWTTNLTSGLCNVVNTYDLFGDLATDGAMINNGTIDIGCGLGYLGNGTATVSIPGIVTPISTGANYAVKEPKGTWLTLARLDAMPIAYCGLQVCAKPTSNTTAPPV